LRSTRLSLLFFLVCLGLLVPNAATAVEEPFFPHAGNRGYDALEYGVKLTFKPQDGTIVASTNVDAVATQNLGRFSLDFFGPRVTEVRVDQMPVDFRRRPGKLIVYPRQELAAGSEFTVGVRYSGRPPRIVGADGVEEGWIPTDDGALAVGEPQGTAAWIPCDNVPADKARFEFAITVGDGLKAIANGRRVRSENRGAGVTFHWSERNPMSSYLAVDIGRGRIVESHIGRVPTWSLTDPRLQRGGREVQRDLPEVLRFESRLFGGYPYRAAGAILDYAPHLGYALEAQSRPIYTFNPGPSILVHEMAHEWFGDSVGLERWPDIWLNEGFATWVQWYFSERHGGPSAQQIFEFWRSPPDEKYIWAPPAGRPGSPQYLFAGSVYLRGAMTLQALREKIGTETMLRVLRTWATEHRHGSANTPEFIELCERLSGRDLERFFQRWLYRRGKP
jgi:aminopeptidase N